MISVDAQKSAHPAIARLAKRCLEGITSSESGLDLHTWSSVLSLGLAYVVVVLLVTAGAPNRNGQVGRRE